MRDKVSVLTVGYNEEDNLKRLYESMEKLTYPEEDYEVVYIDDGSTDDSVEVAESHGAKVIEAEERLGRGGIRNFALEQAEHSLIAWIDADCEIRDPDWIQNMLEHMEEDVAGVSGHQIRPERGLPRLISYLPGMLVEVEGVKETDWAPTTSSLFRKEALQEVGGYRDDLVTAEDLEICRRLQKGGYRFVQTPEAEIVHHFRATLDSFLRQQWERGIFGAALRGRNKGYVDTTMGLAPLLFLAVLASVLLVPELLPVFILIPALVYTGLDGFGSFHRVLLRYLREERSIWGAAALVTLNFLKNLSLFGGVLHFHLNSLFGEGSFI